LIGELSTTSFSYEINMDRYNDSETQPGGSAALSGQRGNLKYLFSAMAEPRYEHNESKEVSILGNFSPNDDVHEDRIREQTDYEYISNLAYEFSPNSSARLNGLYAEKDNPTNVYRQITNLKVTPNTVLTEREDVPGEQNNWEIGGDYEYRGNDGSRYKILFISNESNAASTRERYRLNSDGTESKNLFLDSASVTKERIVRGSYTRNLVGGQNLEVGIERAQTILDSNLRLGTLSSSGTPNPDFGGLVPQPVSNANSKVEEIRFEPFAIHNWQINPRMSLESTLIWETSEITQSGDVYNQRSFDFWKPKLDYRYNVTNTFQIRASLEESVRQLAFQDFVASTDNRDNDTDTQAGNAGLEPETFIMANLNAEYRLPNDMGVINGGINFMRHMDKIERIDVSPSEDNLQSANGNIGDGDMWILSLSSSVRMTPFDMPNLLITSSVNVRDSEIEDPFLGITRRFTNYERGNLSLGFRHDLPQYSMNYGLNWNNRFDGNIKLYDIDDIETQSGDPYVSAFAEFVRFNGITFRFDARNATNAENCRDRYRFVGRTSANILEEIEYQCGGSGRVVSLKINGTF
jgi:outer membrane receptor for ferrienterochelin and colicins